MAKDKSGVEIKKIAVVGSAVAMGGFKMIGAEVVDVNNAEMARERVLEMVKTNEYGIILVEEHLFLGINDADWKNLLKMALPAIIALPGGDRSGVAMDQLRKVCVRAMGQDILK